MHLKNEYRKETIIQKSRFITCVTYATTPEEAKDYIDYIRQEFQDATHVCTAYIVGKNDAYQKSNDNHEPAGTAGIPILEAIRQAGLSNTVCCVVRYFGGIKLGAGGLIRAYGGCTSAALKEAYKVDDVIIDTWHASYPYEYVGGVENWIRTYTSDFTFTYDDQAHCDFAYESVDLESTLMDLTKGNLELKKTGTTIHEVPVTD
ncbi:MAG: YigZ family protein [Bulleidia sp.]|nr:YigZ family protein [Bulleidia sp.]